MTEHHHYHHHHIHKEPEDFMQSRWRPMMAWLYMLTCFFDMIIFPILWNAAQVYLKSATLVPYSPMTLQGGGLYHIAMGAIIGVAAYGRTQEKIATGSMTSTAMNSQVSQTLDPTAGLGGLAQQQINPMNATFPQPVAAPVQMATTQQAAATTQASTSASIQETSVSFAPVNPDPPPSPPAISDKLAARLAKFKKNQ